MTTPKPKRLAVIDAVVELINSVPSIKSAEHDVPFDYETSQQLPRAYVFDADEEVNDLDMGGFNTQNTLTVESDIVFEYRESPKSQRPRIFGNQILAEVKQRVAEESTKRNGPVLRGLAVDIHYRGSAPIVPLATANNRQIAALTVTLTVEYHEQSTEPFLAAA